jgi:hypothetical protein
VPQTRDDEHGVFVRAIFFNGGYAHNKFGSRGIMISTYDQCSTETISEDELRIVSEQAIDLDQGIAAACQH